MYWRFHSGSKMPLEKRRAMTFWTVSLPRKWSMRNTWVSLMRSRISLFRARALGRSWPNGFSTTTRRKAPSSSASSPASARCSMTGPKKRADTAR